MTQGDHRGVGICLGASGAVIALARSHPPQLIALAEVTWPDGMWLGSGQDARPSAVARRMLTRARRRLGLPRRCPVSVVIGPSLSDLNPADVLTGTRGLLAQAGLSQTSVTAIDWAKAMRRMVTVTTGPLGSAAATQEAGLAIGAAIASFAPPPARPAKPAAAPAITPAVAPDVAAPTATVPTPPVPAHTTTPAAPVPATAVAPDVAAPAAPVPAPPVAAHTTTPATPVSAPAVAPDVAAPAAPVPTPAVASPAKAAVAPPVAPGVWQVAVTVPAAEPPPIPAVEAERAKPVPQRTGDLEKPAVFAVTTRKE